MSSTNRDRDTWAKCTPLQYKPEYARATGVWPKASQTSYETSQRRQDCILRSISVRHKLRQGMKNGSVMELERGQIVKFGPRVRRYEADAMKLVAESTSIRVPKVYNVFEKNDQTYIVMEKIKGELLGSVWKKLSEKERQAILGQLKEWFVELRSIPHPRPGTICTAAGDDQPLYDTRILNGKHGFGPFQNEVDFNFYLRGGNKSRLLARTPNLEKLIEMQNQSQT